MLYLFFTIFLLVSYFSRVYVLVTVCGQQTTTPEHLDHNTISRFPWDWVYFKHFCGSRHEAKAACGAIGKRLLRVDSAAKYHFIGGIQLLNELKE